MSRNSVLASTLQLVETIENPNVQLAWAKLKALMKFSHSFDHVSDLVPPTLLSQQSGSYKFPITLTLSEADELGRGREKLDKGAPEDSRSQIHFNSRVLIRCYKVEPDGEVKVDCFPPRCSVRVNEVFHRREGKEGPVDITGTIKVNPALTNHVSLDVPSPSGLYVLTIILVRALSSSAIVRRLSENRIRSAEVTKGRIRRYHELSSSDVTVTSTMFSLVCPLTQKRFVVPAQGENCNHLSCFDLYTYLKINALSSRWLCPICNAKVLPSHLVVDGYWKQVVDLFVTENNDSSTVMVTDEGTWNPKREPHRSKSEDKEVLQVLEM